MKTEKAGHERPAIRPGELKNTDMQNWPVVLLQLVHSLISRAPAWLESPDQAPESPGQLDWKLRTSWLEKPDKRTLQVLELQSKNALVHRPKCIEGVKDFLKPKL